jgi:hypothetical protein
MGADAGDLNNDGLMDLIASDMSGTTRYRRMIDMIDHERSGWFLDWAEPRQYMRNAVYYNSGKERFLEAAYLTGMADTDWTWSILLADLDNDGRLDVFVPNGMTRDWMDSDLAAQAKALPPDQFSKFWRAQPKRADLNLTFQNRGDMRFASVGKAWGLSIPVPVSARWLLIWTTTATSTWLSTISKARRESIGTVVPTITAPSSGWRGATAIALVLEPPCAWRREEASRCVLSPWPMDSCRLENRPRISVSARRIAFFSWPWNGLRER